jgi:hypothetical protein
MRYFESLPEPEKGELSALDREVLESLKQHETPDFGQTTPMPTTNF